MTATPNSCFAFESWSENGVFLTNSPTYTFTATTNRNLTANFVTNIVTVTTGSTPPGGGTVTGAATVNCGDTVALMASNSPGYSFAGWTWINDGVARWVTNSSSFTFAVEANSNLVANFVPLGNSSITTIALPSSGGSVTGGGMYTNSVTATISATAAGCYSFVGWTTNGALFSGSPTTNIIVETNEVFTAMFAQISYNIALTASPGGTVTGGGIYSCGEGVTFYAAPNLCYSFVNWTENGSLVSSMPGFHLVVDTNHSFVANFAPITNAVATISSPANGGMAGGGGLFDCDSNATVTAVANSGYSFVGWTIGGNAVSSSTNFTFTPSGNETLTANFVPNTPVLNFGVPLWSAYGLDLILQGPLGSNYEIQISTDLVNWLPYTNFPLVTSPFYFSVQTATNSNQEFVRAVLR